MTRLKYLRLIAIFLLFCFGGLGGCGSTPLKGGGGISEFHLRTYTEEKLANGADLLVVEDHRLPSVSVSILIKSGESSDSMTKSGVTSLMADVMTKGGDKFSAAQMALGMDHLGAEFDHLTTHDYSWFEVSALTPTMGKALDYFSEAILHPAFKEAEVRRARQIVLSNLTQMKDNPDQWAEREFHSFLYGSHPYGRLAMGLSEDVQGITRRDIINQYKEVISPSNAVIILAGDVPPDLLTRVKDLFGGSWKGPVVRDVTYPPVKTPTGIEIRIVDRPDLTQSQIVLGSRGISRHDKDYLALRLASIILGGDSFSRLTSRVRIQKGLTYSIDSDIEAMKDAGSLEIQTFTRNKKVGEAIQETLSVYRDFIDKGITDDELKIAKNILLAAFPRIVETADHVGMNLALLRLYGLDDSELKSYLDHVNELSKGDVNDAIKKHFDSHHLKVLILGPRSIIEPQVDGIGLVERPAIAIR